jgi:hypothetical protein
MSDKKRYYKRKIRIPIYKGMIVIVFTNQQSKLPTYIQDESIDLYATSFYSDKSGYTKFYIVLNFWDRCRITHSEIAHEIYHTVDSICKYHGIKPAEINEPAAYLDGWITNQVYEFIHKIGLKVHCKYS